MIWATTAASVCGPLSSSSGNWPWHSVSVKPVRVKAGLTQLMQRLASQIRMASVASVAVCHQGEFLVGGLGALQGGLQLAHQLGLLVQGVLAGVQFF